MSPERPVPTGAPWSADGLTDVYLGAYPGLLRLAAFLHHDPGAAEDAVQEAYIRVLARRPDLRDPDGLLAYLRATVVNVCRGAGRRRAVAERYLAATAPSAVAPGAEAALAALFDRHDLVVALRGLPRRQREVVVLRYLADLSEASTAAVLGVSTGSVKAYCSRGVAALASIFGETP